MYEFVAEDVYKPGSEFANEDGRHGFKVKTCAHVSLVVGEFARKAVERVHNAGVGELTANQLEVCELAE